MNRTAILVALTTLVSVGCGGNAGGLSSTGGTPSTTRVSSNTVAFSLETTDERLVSNLWVAAPLARVNESLPAVLESLGFTLSALDEEGTRLRSEPLTVNRRLAGRPVSEYLDCGRNPIGAQNANTQSVEIFLDLELNGGEQGTNVTTRIEAVATPRTSGGGRNHCVTTGKLEQRIVEAVSARLAGDAA